jgi:hypothetical protein
LSLIAPRITQEDNDRLVLPITKEELREALFQMHPDKAPGPTVSIQLSINISGTFVVMIYLRRQRSGLIEVSFHLL